MEKDVNDGKITFDENGRAPLDCSEQKAKEYASIFDAELSKEESKIPENEPTPFEPKQSLKRNQKTR
ncbi:MAG: hypothetical protein LCH52_08305 [Bacteroidetes bacterium]|nr:hypothetical protein [Bacteroidota bacterium]